MNASGPWLLFGGIWLAAAALVGGLYGLIRWIDGLPPGSASRQRLRGAALLLGLAIFVLGTLGGVSRLGRKIRAWQGSTVAPVEADRPAPGYGLGGSTSPRGE